MLKAIEDRGKPANDEDKRWEILSGRYFEKLNGLISALDFGDEPGVKFTVKHYFNGAAVYADETICASWSPVGLAFRLPAAEVAELIDSGRAIPLKYFAKGRVKKAYALFDNPGAMQKSTLKTYFLKAAQQAMSTRMENRA